MKALSRVLLVAGAPLVLAVFLWTAWEPLSGVRQCQSFYCGRNFDPGGLDVFGHQLFTPAQTAVIALGILVAAFILALGLLPRSRYATAAGASVLAVTAVIALTLPSPRTGPAPTVPCATPGPNGSVPGACIVGSAPVDSRVEDRVLLMVGGLAVLALGVFADRRRWSRTAAEA